ncbi:MAG TPA: hypothetical protein VKP11_03815 [Frankiaceae bacterium]|nr:hypothetical protein [Frankiaceae bacterium]
MSVLAHAPGAHRPTSPAGAPTAVLAAVDESSALAQLVARLRALPRPPAPAFRARLRDALLAEARSAGGGAGPA